MSQTTKQIVTQLIKDKNIKIKKHLGQNFLIDERMLKQIIDSADIDQETLVIEVGPGLGSLTHYLLDNAAAVMAYEIDKSFIPILNQRFSDKDNFKLIHDDILNRDLDVDIQTYFKHKKVVLIANLPYYITTPILFKCLEESSRIARYVVMMQYEVAKRFTANVSTKDYNALSVAMQFRTQTRYLFKVPRQAFIPEPNVDSAVISLDVNQSVRLDDNMTQFFFQFIKQAFKQRRKTLVNNIHAAYGIDKATIEKHISDAGHLTNCRAESLSVEQLYSISCLFYDIMNK